MKIPAMTADLVADLYDSALDDEAWPQFAGHVAKAVGVHGSAALLIDTGEVVAMSATETVQPSLADYQGYYHALDPWRKVGLVSPPDAVILSNELFPESEYVKTEFYNDYARHFGIKRPMNVYMPLTRNIAAAVGVEQPFASRLAEQSDKISLECLVPYLKRALQLRCRLQDANARGRVSWASLNSLAIGIVTCDAKGQILYANAAAEALSRNGAGIVLGNRKKGIGALKPAQANALRQIIHDAATGGAGGAIGLTDADGFSVLFALVTPLPRSLTGTPGYALVALRRASEEASFSSDLLTTLFRLSPAQASLAIALYNGQTLESYAHERDVKISTVRTHLAEIFAKTGMENQRSLVKLIGTIPPLR